jgi:hypothetical protein
MRTTLELDDDLIAAAKDIARQEGTTLGQIISRLARQSLESTASLKVRNGVPLFQPVAGVSHSDMRIVNALRDDA